MVRLVRYMTLLGVLLLATLSANAADRGVVRLEGVVRVTHISTGGMNLWLAFDNERCHSLVIKRGVVDIYVGEHYVMSISLRDKVVIPRRSRSEVLLPLRFTSSGGLQTITVLKRLLSGDEQISCSYSIRGGTRLIKRTFRAENVAISEFFDNFAISNSLADELRYIIE